MGYTARWGPKGFLISSNKVVPFEGLTTSFSLKTDNNTDANGTATSNVRGMELQPISFSTRYYKSMGVEPLAQIEEWKNLVGASYPLYIKNKRFGPAKVTLKTVNVSDVITDNSGTILSCAMAFSFEEYTKPVPTSSSSSGSSGSDDSTGPDPNGKAAQVFNAVSAERQMAMSATASAEDKAAKDPARHDTGH